MARKETDYIVKADGRDKDKVFRITEASAWAQEDWAMRLFLSLARGGIDVPDGIAQAGLAGVVALGVRALGQLKHEDAAPLLREMLDCVKLVPSAKNIGVTRDVIESDIEEVRTLIDLRKAVIELHTGFSFADVSLGGSRSAKKKPVA